MAVSSIRSLSSVTSVATERSRCSDRTTRAGWTVGGGVEYALNRNWSIGAEYLYMDFGKDTLNSAGAPSIPVTSVTFHDRSQVARAALNYKF